MAYSRRHKRKKNDQLIIAVVALLALGLSASFSQVSAHSLEFIVGTVLITVLFATTFAVIFLIIKRQRSAQAHRALEMAGVNQMTGVEFESLVEDILRSRGFTNVRGTPVTGDMGVDIHARYNGESYVVQTKRLSSKADNTPIQEAVGAQVAFKSDRAMVVTNATFTKQAISFGTLTHCILIGRDDFARWFLKFKES